MLESIRKSSRMRWFRSRRWIGGSLALFALAVQLGVSFGHIHERDLLPGNASASKVAGASRQAPITPAQPSDPDGCAVCAIVAMAASLAIPAPPAIVHAPVWVSAWLPDRATVAAPSSRRQQFQARGPPV
ncbi:MAG TPA: hypothetical protein VK281_21520 [Xanthobacteraceae bacterium]|jgi:hypothetical protein|nr:hypothetical protein [Xanthobacteraceae bacterium]